MTFSIILPTHNRPNKLRLALESILNQTYSDYEVIVVNDRSTQDYTEIKAFISEQSRISYYEVEFENRSKARNYGIARAQGAYICFLDDDDIYYPNHLEVFHNYINNSPIDSRFMHTYSVVSNQEKVKEKIGRSGKQGPDRVIEEPFGINSVCVERSLLLEHNFNEQLHYWEDKELWLRLANWTRIESIAEYTNEYVFHLSETDGNTINFSNLESMRNRLFAIRYIRKHHKNVNRGWINKALKRQYKILYSLCLNNNNYVRAISVIFEQILFEPRLLANKQGLLTYMAWGREFFSHLFHFSKDVKHKMT